MALLPIFEGSATTGGSRCAARGQKLAKKLNARSGAGRHPTAPLALRAGTLAGTPGKVASWPASAVPAAFCSPLLSPSAVAVYKTCENLHHNSPAELAADGVPLYPTTLHHLVDVHQPEPPSKYGVT